MKKYSIEIRVGVGNDSLGVIKIPSTRSKRGKKFKVTLDLRNVIFSFQIRSGSGFRSRFFDRFYVYSRNILHFLNRKVNFF